MRRVALAVAALLAACDPTPVAQLVLSADVTVVPADGTSRVQLTATLARAHPGDVVRFELSGPGLLSTTQARVRDGKAVLEVFAPLEDEIRGDSASSRVVAHALVDGLPLESAAELRFEIPAEGAPVLAAWAVPDRVRAGGSEPIRLVLEGRRLTDPVIGIAAEPASTALPPSITLVSDGLVATGEIEVMPPATPGRMQVTLTGGGAAPTQVELVFIGDDEPTFDVSGTFAQITYGVVRIGGLIFLDPDPQCVVAPTVSLVNIEQSGGELRLHSEVCDIQMPSVNVVLIGASDTWVDPRFVDAANAQGSEDLTVGVGTDGAWQVNDSAYDDPLVVGAALSSPTEALPTAADDARVRDDDGDGHPGVTIHNSSQGDQFTAYRTRTVELAGAVADSDTIDGSVTAETETVLFNGGGIAPEVRSMPSPFHLRRVDGRNGAPDISGRSPDGAAITCADVRAWAAELMVAAPGPDPAHACD